MSIEKIGGYIGIVLQVDLTEKKFEIKKIDRRDMYQHIGGTHLGAKYLYKMTDSRTDPLSADNPLIFMTGPLTGTKATTSSRHAVVAKSPLTGIWGEADVGGSWGLSLKRSGYDGVIVKGRAAAPSIIFISDEKVEIINAGDYWGLDTIKVDEAIKKNFGDKVSIASIGPAGERVVPIACIMHDGRHARAAGRCGLGAVMGSKLLKAVVVKPGNLKPDVFDKELLNSSMRAATKTIKEKTARLTNGGTASGVVPNAEIADMPSKNWTVGNWVENAKKISGEALNERFFIKRYHCPGCIIGCGRTVKLTSGPYSGSEVAGPEYESLAGLGSMLLVDDLEAIVEATDQCNRLGIDVISAGNAIAFGMEAFEKGLITLEDTGGMALKWGNSEAVVWAIDRIGHNEGLGRILGLGTKKAAEILGNNANEFSVHVKGLELPFHDPRALSSLAVSYATQPRGACHRGVSYSLERGPKAELGFDYPLDRFAVERKAEAAIKMQDYAGSFNDLKLCQMLLAPLDVSVILDWLNAVTGSGYSLQDFLRAGERATNLKRMYNVRCGVSRKDDTLPPRILTLIHKEGGAAGHVPHLGRMLSEYYELRGWSEEGIPLPAKLKELELDDIL